MVWIVREAKYSNMGHSYITPQTRQGVFIFANSFFILVSKKEVGGLLSPQANSR